MDLSNSNSAPRLSLILPCFDEEKRLPASLARVREYLDASGWEYEILVVDDGSRDRTVDEARRVAAGDPRIRVIGYGENRGKGAAVRFGALQAAGEWVLFSDADLSTPIEELSRLLPYLSRGFDVVIGSRALAGSDLKVRQPWWRERVGRLVNWCVRRLSGLPFPDTQCGFKLFSRRAARDVFSNLTVCGWMFDVEALVLAQRLGYRAVDVPVTWINSGESRAKLSHAPRTVLELLHIRSYWLGRQPAAASDREIAASTPR